MAVLMLFDKDNFHSDPDREYSGCYKKGYVVEVLDDSKSLVIPPQPPFVFLRVLDRTKAELLSYQESWKRTVDYSVINRDVAQDGWRLEIKATNANVSGKGHLTQAMVEAYLAGWNAIVVGFVNNGVRFDVSVYLVATSERFWERNVSSILFNELSYDTGTGVHRISADYNAFPFPPNTTVGDFEASFSRAVENHQGTVISNGSGVIVFDLDRDIVVQKFRDDVKAAVQDVICRRQDYLDPALIDQIISNGRYMEMNAIDIVPYIKSRLTE